MKDLEAQIAALNQRFGSASVQFFDCRSLPAVRVSNRLGSAEITLLGAHVISFVPAGEKPVIWMSRECLYAEGKALRGGVPVCWPWFGPDASGKFGSHGYARISNWEIDSCRELPNGESEVTLLLNDQMVDPQFAPRPFHLHYTVTVGKTLTLALRIENRSDRTVTYSGALHTYFNVSDSRTIRVGELDGVEYDDRIAKTVATQSGDLIVDREIDRIYATSGRTLITDPGYKRVIEIAKAGSKFTVVWNPWIEKSIRMADFGNDEYLTMVCVEAANTKPRELPPFGTAELRQVISTRAL